SKIEISQLWGVHFAYWPSNASELLRSLDRARCCVTLELEGDSYERPLTPQMPADLRYLIVNVKDSDSKFEFASFGSFKELRLLSIDSFSNRPIDLRQLETCVALRHLHLATPAEHWKSIATLTEL